MTKLSEVRPPHFGLTESAAPATPAAGEFDIYAATDGTLHSINDAAVDTEYGAAVFVGVKALNTGTQTGVIDSALAFDSEEFDTDAFHDNSTNNSRLTVPAGQGGKYLIFGGGFANGAAGVYIELNGTTKLTAGRSAQTGGAAYFQFATTVVDLVATDYVEAVATSTATYGDASAGPDDTMVFGMYKIA